ncbi:MAG: hypothetical protein FD143_464 [Ignavibacteria bacterium]|nr:MAG: hypothetical protein FD143_464 [Ignavibacteria bacterium]KAF0161535.1 MAG: hypothetical protein FD188_652 [Ignavibacteria bacterium]
MRRLLFVTFCFLFSLTTLAQSKNAQYDSTLAKSLGADNYGMKNYVFVILKTGPAVIEKKETRDSLFAGHMKNINRLVDANKLIAAGPFGKNDLKYRGLFILDVKTIEEAKELVNTDPAVAAKIFDVELIPWYGSAALKEYLKYVEKITKYKL